MFSIDEPHYYCSAITNPTTHFYVIFSHFNIHCIKDINNLSFQIFTFNGLGDTLYFYIVPSTIPISVICSNYLSGHPLIGRFDFQAYRHSFVMMKPHSLNSLAVSTPPLMFVSGAVKIHDKLTHCQFN